MDMHEFYEYQRIQNIIAIIVYGTLFITAIILVCLIKIRNKHVRLEPKRQKIVDKTISDEEYITTFIKSLIKNKYSNEYYIILGKLKNKKLFTMDDIQNIAINVRKLDEESVIDGFLLALSVEYIGEEIYALVRNQPRSATRDWNTIISKLKIEHKVEVDIDFNIKD